MPDQERRIEPTQGAVMQPTCDEKEHYPPRREMLRQHEININFFDRGCMIRVGCKSIAFSNTEEAMKEINEYVTNPRESIKKWNKIFNENE